MFLLPVTIQSPMPIQPIAPQLANENLQVYIRRRKRQELEHGSQSTCGQYIDSNSSLPEENIGVGDVQIHPIGNYVTYEGLSPSYRAFATSLDDTQVPNTIQEALKISEWKKAVQDEIDALKKNGTWTITDLPVGKRPMGETFAPVAKLNTIRILLSLAVNQDWCLQQLDIKNAFLNGDLEEKSTWKYHLRFEESMAKNQIKEGNCSLSRKIPYSIFLRRTGMLGCKPIDTPMDSQKKLGIEKERKGLSSERQRTVTLNYTQMRIGQETSLTDGPTSRYCSFVWGNLVTWRSKKQSVVARSSAEAEYRALAQGISKNPVHHDRTKHVEIDRHFITEKVTSEMVKLNYVPTKHQTADILTKALPRPNFEDLNLQAGII
ncbi:hypothetical protein CK203_063573 [Vitis vinifera]|uniref:Reverse transcriptase Ty1/copia-type domain-containing protein n=1 Tax=Vitis vinifera TaxID=29760 RepID=A0A438G7R0_VITVI|nr:hypothetical protein CK203_063573 [Vitis vinifera]